MAKHYDKHFKLDAVQCYHDHRELGLIGYAANLGLNHHPLKLAPQNEPTKNMLFFSKCSTANIFKNYESPFVGSGYQFF